MLITAGVLVECVAIYIVLAGHNGDDPHPVAVTPGGADL